MAQSMFRQKAPLSPHKYCAKLRMARVLFTCMLWQARQDHPWIRYETDAETAMGSAWKGFTAL